MAAGKKPGKLRRNAVRSLDLPPVPIEHFFRETGSRESRGDAHGPSKVTFIGRSDIPRWIKMGQLYILSHFLPPAHASSPLPILLSSPSTFFVPNSSLFFVPPLSCSNGAFIKLDSASRSGDPDRELHSPGGHVPP